MSTTASQKTFGQLVGEYRTKHTPFITQAQLANTLGVSRQTIIRIENNREHKTGRTTAFVGRLADILGIAGREREEFFATTGLLPDCDELSPTEEQDQRYVIARFYRDFSAYPAFVFDDFYDVHSVNSYVVALLVGSFDVIAQRFKQAPAGNNILHMMFDPDFGMRSGAGNDWRRMMETHVYYFRLKTGKYVKTPRFQKLIKVLTALPDFAEVWETTHHSNFGPQLSPFPNRVRSLPDLEHEPSFLIVRPVIEPQFSWLNDRITMFAYMPANQWAEQVLAQLRQQEEFKVYKVDFIHGLAEMPLNS